MDTGHWIKTVARCFSWASPAVIDSMYLDSKDHHGLGYWYNDVIDQHREYEANKPKK